MGRRYNPIIALMIADPIYVMFFAFVMLNVDAHNERIQKSKKMTLDQFHKQLIGFPFSPSVSTAVFLTKQTGC